MLLGTEDSTFNFSLKQPFQQVLDNPESFSSGRLLGVSFWKAIISHLGDERRLPNLVRISCQ